MEPSISSTKIRPPRLPALSLRPRLFGQLQQACHHPVIWISGPPGAGKTALLKSFIDSRALPAFWYRFDQTDNDPQRFFHYCQCVVKQLDRGTAATLPDFCTLVTEPAVFSPGFFAAMFEQLPTPMTLVFDDYQRLADHALLHKLLNDAIDLLPAGSNLFILSRRPPPAAYARQITSGSLLQLDTRSLSFTHEESTDLIRLRAAHACSPQTIATLQQLSEGWAAALILLSEHPEALPVRFNPTALTLPKALLDYFELEIFAGIDPVTQTVLLRTATLNRVPADIVAALSAIRNAAALIDDLSDCHYFVVKTSGTPVEYRYHPLLRRFLLIRAETCLSGSRQNALYRRMAGLLFQHGAIEQSVQLYSRAHAWKMLDGLLPVHMRGMTAACQRSSQAVEISGPDVRTLCSLVMVATLYSPQEPALEFWAGSLQRLLAVRPAASGDYLCSVCTLLWFYQQRGDFNHCRQLLAGLPMLNDSGDVPVRLRLSVHALAAWLEQELNEPAACLHRVTAGLELARRSANPVLEHRLLIIGASAGFHGSESESVWACLQQLPGDPAGMSPWDTVQYQLLMARDAFSRSAWECALAGVGKSIQIARSSGMIVSETLGQLALVQICWAQGRTDLAVQQTHRLSDLIRCSGCRQLLFAELLCRAYLKLQQNQRQSALNLLRQALKLGRENAYPATSIWYTPMLVQLCAIALEAAIETGYTGLLIQQQSLLPEAESCYLEQWPWPVRIYTLGRFCILLNGQPLAFARKVQHQPLQLLKALLAFGAREVALERLADTLWPDADGDAAHDVLITNLQRLRKLLGHKQALILSDNRLSLNSRYCWVDYQAFQHLLQRARETAQASLQQQLQKQAFRLYSGVFLGTTLDAESWMTATRERLRSRYLALTRELGRRLEQTGDWLHAARVYEQALEADDKSEDFYRRLMMCYERLDQQRDDITRLPALLSQTGSPDRHVIL